MAFINWSILNELEDLVFRLLAVVYAWQAARSNKAMLGNH